MKTFDFKAYEKLKIRPVNINKLDSRKNTLKTFDLVKLHDNYFMTFLKKDVLTYSNSDYLKKVLYFDKYPNGVFIRYNEKSKELSWMYVDQYDADFKRKNGKHDWDITEIWKCNASSENMFWQKAPFKLDDLNQLEFNRMIFDYNYTLEYANN